MADAIERKPKPAKPQPPSTTAEEKPKKLFQRAFRGKEEGVKLPKELQENDKSIRAIAGAAEAGKKKAAYGRMRSWGADYWILSGDSADSTKCMVFLLQTVIKSKEKFKGPEGVEERLRKFAEIIHNEGIKNAIIIFYPESPSCADNWGSKPEEDKVKQLNGWLKEMAPGAGQILFPNGKGQVLIFTKKGERLSAGGRPNAITLTDKDCNRNEGREMVASRKSEDVFELTEWGKKHFPEWAAKDLAFTAAIFKPGSVELFNASKKETVATIKKPPVPGEKVVRIEWEDEQAPPAKVSKGDEEIDKLPELLPVQRPAEPPAARPAEEPPGVIEREEVPGTAEAPAYLQPNYLQLAREDIKKLRDNIGRMRKAATDGIELEELGILLNPGISRIGVTGNEVFVIDASGRRGVVGDLGPEQIPSGAVLTGAYTIRWGPEAAPLPEVEEAEPVELTAVEDLITQAGAHFKRGDNDKALTAINAAIGIDPNNRSAYSLQSQVLNAMGLADEAAQASSKAKKLAAAEAQELFESGKQLASKGDSDGAVSAYEKALKLNPNHDGALFGKATVLYNMRKFERSREIVKGFDMALTLRMDALAVRIKESALLADTERSLLTKLDGARQRLGDVRKTDIGGRIESGTMKTGEFAGAVGIFMAVDESLKKMRNELIDAAQEKTEGQQGD